LSGGELREEVALGRLKEFEGYGRVVIL